MIQHLYFGYGIGLCGTPIKGEHVINKEDGGITFGPGDRCPKCVFKMQAVANQVLDQLIGVERWM